MPFLDRLQNRWFALKCHWEVLFRRLTLNGPLWLISRVFKRAAYNLGWLLLLPITLALHLAGFRRLMVYPDRIGHLAAEIDGFLKEQFLGRVPAKRYFVLSLANRTANICLLHDYWSKLIPVVRNRIAARLLEIMSSRWLLRHSLSHLVLTKESTSSLYQIYAEWKRPPLLKLTAEHKEKGYAALRRLGLPRDAWFVALHVREPGYSPADEMHMDFRNSDPRNLIPSIEEIVKRGGYCVRMGDIKSEPLPTMEGLIDYPRSVEKSDSMDVFLPAECRFFLGVNSGLHFVANVFGKPVALANLAPIGTLPPCSGDIGIPKFVRRIGSETIMSFAEALALPSARYQRSIAFRKDGIELVEHDANDILSLINEMLDRLEEKWVAQESDERLQTRYRSLLTSGHFSYGSLGRIGTHFLRRHEALLKI